jgi:hypothetical protein
MKRGDYTNKIVCTHKTLSQSMLIAIHTFIIIVIRWHPNNAFVGCALAGIWTFVVVMTSLGGAVGDAQRGPFCKCSNTVDIALGARVLKKMALSRQHSWSLVLGESS